MEAVLSHELTKKALDDFQLVEQAQHGKQQAYAVLMERHRSSIFHLMLRMTRNSEDAHDLTLEAFGKAFTRLGSYTPNYAFSTWLYKIAMNNCIDFVRKKRLNTLSIDEPFEADGDQDYTNTLEAHSLNPEEEIIREQRIDLIRNLLDRLSDKYRVMIELRYFQEMSYEEIAQLQGLPLGTVKAQLFRAKELLLEYMQRPGAGAYIDMRTRCRAAAV